MNLLRLRPIGAAGSFCRGSDGPGRAGCCRCAFGGIAAVEILFAEGQADVFFFDHFERFLFAWCSLLPLVLDDPAHAAPFARLHDIEIAVRVDPDAVA